MLSMVTTAVFGSNVPSYYFLPLKVVRLHKGEFYEFNISFFITKMSPLWVDWDGIGFLIPLVAVIILCSFSI